MVIGTLAELCRVRARSHGAHRFVDDGTVSLTYAELAERAEAAAAALADHGVRPGDRVVVQGRNSAGWVVAGLGALLAGATLAPLGYGAPAAERDRIVERLSPRARLCDADLAGDGWLPIEGLASSGPAPAVELDPDAAALVLSSSGTTGAVKSVPMSHHQLLRLYDDVAERLRIVDTDRLLGVVPLAHSFGFNGLLLVAMLRGASVRLCPRYDAAGIAELAARDEVTVLAGPPAVFHDLAASAPGPIPSARLAIVGGQAVSMPDVVRTVGSLGATEVVIGYGMTEACGSVALSRFPIDAAATAAGLEPLPGVEVQVLDDAGDPVRETPGRLLVRGYNVVRPYAQAPDLEAGGWLDTGDLGVLHDDGRVSVVGRTSDLVIASGFNVYPAEVESVLTECPEVDRVAVLGVPDPRRGQRLVACVVPTRDGVDPAAITAYARTRLSAYKVPTDVVLVPELPLTGTGKIARARLRELVAGRLGSGGRDRTTP